MSSPIEVVIDGELQAALLKMFALARISPPPKTITGSDVLYALRKIQHQLENPGLPPSTIYMDETVVIDGAQPDLEKMHENPFLKMAATLHVVETHRTHRFRQNILIVGELGIVTYQLKMALKRLGPKVTIAKGVDEAIREYRQKPYHWVIIDLLMPTEREGLLVLEAIRQQENSSGASPNIVILCSPVKDRSAEIKQMCETRGVSLYLEKIEGWHQRMMEMFIEALAAADAQYRQLGTEPG